MQNKEWVLSVAQLNEYARKLLAGDPILRSVSVKGEISGFKRHISGHMYFALKDDKARINCVLFRQNALGLTFTPRDGMQVKVRGSVSLFVRDGAYQLYAEEMEKEGVGELYARFERLKAALAAEGLFDASLKKTIPMLPKTVGVVTSRTGAVLRDIVRVAHRRNPRVDILLCPASVQGESAARELAMSLDRLNADGRADVILIGRGGGSIEDLWAFNEEIVARAIARSRIPVVSCVGHETDFTIADFAADLRAPTPSAAAELAVPERGELQLALSQAQRRMTHALKRGMDLRGERLNRLKASMPLAQPVRYFIQPRREQLARLSGSIALSDPARLFVQPRREALARLSGSTALTQPVRLFIQPKREALGTLEERLERAMQEKMRYSRETLAYAAHSLEAVSPRSVLGRGYALVYKGKKIVRDAADLPVGTPIYLQLKDSRVAAEVTENGKENDV